MSARSVVLAVDIGASKVRVGAFEAERGVLRAKAVERYVSREWNGLVPVLERFVRDAGLTAVEAVAVGVAGPVSGNRATMTNLPWIVESESLEKAMGARRALVMNDLVAHGFGIGELRDGDYETLRAGTAKPGNRALLAAGSGLGMCTIHWTGERYHPSPSEGGHGTFGPRNAGDQALFTFLLARYPEHVSWERVVSGHYGFRNLYDFLKTSGNVEEPAELAEAVRGKSEIGAVLQDAASRGVPLAKATLDAFFELYGAAAGNLALQALALNGVYLAGGIARRSLSALRASRFLEAFSAKGRMRPLLEAIPVHVVTDVESPIKGLARCALESLDNG
jgi:glucokinase